MTFRQGEEIELLEAEDLYFNSAIFRRGNKGERFVVADHRPSERRLFVLSKDRDNRMIALNLPDSSAGPVVLEWAAYAEKTFRALEDGRIKEAKALLGGLSKEPRMQPVCKKILDSIQAVESKSAEFLVFQRNKQKAAEDIAQRKKSASTPPEHGLDPGHGGWQMRPHPQPK